MIFSDGKNRAPIHVACGNDEVTPILLEKIKILIEKKADLNARMNKRENSALHIACNNKNISIDTIELLLENKADINGPGY